MDQVEKATLQLHDALKECFEQIRFARAAELARSRRYLEAECLLAPNGRVPSDPKELDLLARISAQQRQYERARHLWETALRQSPGNADYERAIDRARDAEHYQAMLQKGATIALSALAAASLIIVVWNLLPRHSPTAASAGKTQPTAHTKTKPLPSSRLPPQPTQLPQSEQRQQTLAESAALLQSEPVHPSATPRPVPATPQPVPPSTHAPQNQ